MHTGICNNNYFYLQTQDIVTFPEIVKIINTKYAGLCDLKGPVMLKTLGESHETKFPCFLSWDAWVKSFFDFLFQLGFIPTATRASSRIFLELHQAGPTSIPDFDRVFGKNWSHQ